MRYGVKKEWVCGMCIMKIFLFVFFTKYYGEQIKDKIGEANSGEIKKKKDTGGQVAHTGEPKNFSQNVGKKNRRT